MRSLLCGVLVLVIVSVPRAERAKVDPAEKPDLPEGCTCVDLAARLRSRFPRIL